MYTDASCYHAALATLLVQEHPGTRPEVVLGCRAGTRAVEQNGGLLFGDLWPALQSLVANAGHRVLHTAADEGVGLPELAETLVRHGSAVAVLDTFHLDHFWMARRQVHTLHSVVLREFDAADGSVRMIDPGDVVSFDGRLTLSSLEPALTRTPLGQSWVVFELRADAQAPRQQPAPWSAHRSALVGTHQQTLSGTQLMKVLGGLLPVLFAAGRSQPGGGPVPAIPALQRGLWSYHHTLRWFARYLRAGTAADGTAPDTAAAVDRAAQDLLVIRSLLRRAGLGDPDWQRYRREIERRLDRIEQSLHWVAAALPDPSAAAKEPDGA